MYTTNFCFKYISVSCFFINFLVGRVVAKSDFNENPVESLDLDLEFGLQQTNKLNNRQNQMIREVGADIKIQKGIIHIMEWIDNEFRRKTKKKSGESGIMVAPALTTKVNSLRKY